MDKKRLDIELLERELVPSRSQARSLIKNGSVLVNKRVETKPGFLVVDSDEVQVTEEIFVGRGALKLKKALEVFDLDLVGKMAADIGASTGGFTEILLSEGVAKVFAIDVGHDQLAQSLREDKRVVNLEGVNVKYPIELDTAVDIAVIDLSFISLTKVMENIKNILKDDGEVVALIKPQFEVGSDKIGKKGIVTKESYRQEAVENLKKYFKKLGFNILALIDSPIQGKEGNKEFLIHLTR